MEKSKNKKLIFGAIISLLVIIGLFFVIKPFLGEKKVERVDTNKTIKKTVIDEDGNEQVTAKVTEVFNSGEIKDLQKGLKIPTEYDSCKEDTDMIGCIIHFDKETEEAKEFLTVDFVSAKLNEIDDFKENLIQEEKEVEDIVSDELQEYYSLKNPGMIFENFDCENNFCKQTIIKTKKVIVGRMVSRGKITNSHCSKIPEKEVQNLCSELIKN